MNIGMTSGSYDILLLLEYLAIKVEDQCYAISLAISIEELLAEMIPLLTAQLRAVSSSAVEDDNGVKRNLMYNH